MEIVTLDVTPREATGTKACRKLRQGGKALPGVIYGQGREPIPITVNYKTVVDHLHHGHRVFKVDTGHGLQLVILKEVQWDRYGDRVLHIDLSRIAETDRLEVQIRVEFKGDEEAPGVKEGGWIERIRSYVLVECPAMNIPETVTADVSSLEMDSSFRCADLPLPDGVSLAIPGHLVVAVCHAPKGVEEGPAEGEGEGETAAEGATEEGAGEAKPSDKD